MNIPSGMMDTFVGLIFEIGIFILFLILLTLIGLHYRARKTEYTKKMLWFFSFYAVALLFSWISKAINLALETPNFEDVDPTMPGYFILARILQFRVSFVFMIMGTYVTQRLRVTVFETRTAKTQNLIVLIWSGITIVFSAVFLDPGMVVYDVIAFLLVAVEMMVVYIPFAISSLRMRKLLAEPIYRKASTSLAIMALSFIMIFVNFLLDRIMIMTAFPDGFTVFYFLAWISAIVGVVAVYVGYIRPGQQQHLQADKQPPKKEDSFEEDPINPEIDLH